MLYQLLQDAWKILLFRYQAPDAYRYSLFTVLGILLLLGLVNAVAMSPLLGGGAAAIVLSILLTSLKWWLLAKVMKHWLNQSRSPTSWLGYTLATEALTIPLLLVFYQPVLAGLGLLWQIWTFLAQASGFMRMSNASSARVILGYVWYFLATMLIGTLLVMLFVQVGAIDLPATLERIQHMLTQSPTR